MTSFESGGIENLPPRMLAFGNVLNIYRDLMTEYLRKYEERHGNPHKYTLEQVSYLPLLQVDRLDLSLPSIGADQMSIHHVALDPATGKKAVNTFEELRIIEVGLDLYQDGSPYVADEDFTDEYDVFYHIILGREEFPYITHESNFGTPAWITPEKIANARKVYLSDQECIELIEVLRNCAEILDTGKEHWG